MSTLLTTHDLSKSFGTHILFSGIAIGLVEGDRLGLIGPNGAGKSTLLKILAGQIDCDEGDITRRRKLTLAYVAQDDRFPADSTPIDAVVQSLSDHDTAAHHGLDPVTRAQMVLSRLGFDHFEQPVGTLSGGWRKRLSIACSVVREPDVLLLDEPTNHLDLEGVRWLEAFVQQSEMAVVFITHDRTFLENAANRIIELSAAYPDGSFEVKGNYSAFVKRKEAYLQAQVAQQTALAGKVRRDTAWLKQGIQGRQTRNKTQVAASQNRQGELKSLQDRNRATNKSATVDFQTSERKTRKLLEVQGASKSLGGKPLFSGLDLMLSPGTRIGLLGPNGSGKTTLMRLLTDELEPDEGTVSRADRLRIANFTQHRDQLNPNDTLRDALCPVGDTVVFQDKPMHVSAWAKRFLFDPNKFRTTVANLSGGEQARILIAQLMLKPADVLILDEPTNDLDIPTLEILEDSLAKFPGAIVLVSHDRFMLRRLSTEVVAFDGKGGCATYASYEQWEQANLINAAYQESSHSSVKDSIAPSNSSNTRSTRSDSSSKKLTYKLQRELDQMEETILHAESELEALQNEAGDPSVMADHARYSALCNKLAKSQEHIRDLYERWEELEAM